ncbi:MAG: hypothetical protein M1819_007319 [Sarea resinae]|nr:MAG: hypothetical protein M1819_007319 [Sarea resinae]
MPFQYKKVLVIGATSGIGEALANRFVKEGSSVIVVGRRKENLDAFVKDHGRDKAEARQFDLNHLDRIPQFAQDITTAHPDLDCVFMNSGIQRGLDFSKPESVNLDDVGTEFQTNYISYIHLLKAFLPFLLKKKSESGIIFTSSGLALVPLIRCPNYCATKAALHQLILALREQLKESKIKIIEIFPPAVQTELHDKKHQPDIENGRQFGMPLQEFLDESYAGLVNGDIDIPVGSSKDWYNSFEPARQESFHNMNARIAGKK